MNISLAIFIHFFSQLLLLLWCIGKDDVVSTYKYILVLKKNNIVNTVGKQK